MVLYRTHRTLPWVLDGGQYEREWTDCFVEYLQLFGTGGGEEWKTVVLLDPSK